MYTVSRSSARVCVIINSKCCSPQIKASGFGTKHSMLINPKQVSVRYRLSFTLLSSSPPLSSVPPTLPTSSADIGLSSANPLVTEKRRGEREKKRWRGVWQESRRGVGDEKGKGGVKKSKLKRLFSIKTAGSGMTWDTSERVCPNPALYSKLSIYTSKLKGHWCLSHSPSLAAILSLVSLAASQHWLQLKRVEMEHIMNCPTWLAAVCVCVCAVWLVDL